MGLGLGKQDAMRSLAILQTWPARLSPAPTLGLALQAGNVSYGIIPQLMERNSPFLKHKVLHPAEPSFRFPLSHLKPAWQRAILSIFRRWGKETLRD